MVAYACLLPGGARWRSQQQEGGAAACGGGEEASCRPEAGRRLQETHVPACHRLRQLNFRLNGEFAKFVAGGDFLSVRAHYRTPEITVRRTIAFPPRCVWQNIRLLRDKVGVPVQKRPLFDFLPQNGCWGSSLHFSEREMVQTPSQKNQNAVPTSKGKDGRLPLVCPEPLSPGVRFLGV